MSNICAIHIALRRCWLYQWKCIPLHRMDNVMDKVNIYKWLNHGSATENEGNKQYCRTCLSHLYHGKLIILLCTRPLKL